MVKFDDLLVGLDYLVGDFLVNLGLSCVVKELQKFVGIDQDGVMGVWMFVVVVCVDLVGLICVYNDCWFVFLKLLKMWLIFGKGWVVCVKLVWD